MKKFIGIAVLSVAAITLSACTSPAQKSQLQGKVENYQTEGFIDTATLQVKGLGAPASDAKGFVKRRTQSKEAALLSAQKRVIEMCVGAKISAASGSDSGESTGVAITKELEGVMKGGQIVQESYDGDDNCELVYRVYSKNIQKQCEALASSKDFR